VLWLFYVRPSPEGRVLKDNDKPNTTASRLKVLPLKTLSSGEGGAEP